MVIVPGAIVLSRGFQTYSALSEICAGLMLVAPEGLCSSLMVQEGASAVEIFMIFLHKTVLYEWEGSRSFYTKMSFCGRVIPYIPPRLNGPRWTIKREKTWQELECGKVNYVCVLYHLRKYTLNKK
jgi:hypothetical protein